MEVGCLVLVNKANHLTNLQEYDEIHIHGSICHFVSTDAIGILNNRITIDPVLSSGEFQHLWRI